MNRSLGLVAGLAAWLAGGAVWGQTLAFPGAMGFGKYATGGRSGTVYHVTTLADSGAGSFRDAVSSANRIVVFDVGGYINLASAVSVNKNITIAGQTAPGGGIGFKGGEISFANRSNIICRYIRVRPGSDTASNTDDALSLYRSQNVICDHVSLEFGPWNNVGAVSDDWQNYPVTSVTFQDCLNANPTYQQFGAHTESVSSTMAWLGCIFANSHNRNPMSKINDVFVNNVLYNCSAGYTTHTSTEFSHDIVNNYFIAGPAYSSSANFPWFQVDNNQSIYYSGNLFDGDRDNVLGGALTTPYWYQGGGTVLSAPWSAETEAVLVRTPAAAYRIAVSQAGALPRDQVDDLVISQVKTLGRGTTGTGVGTAGPDGSLYDSQSQTGLGNNGYGVINGGVAPIDSDLDGMPDYWEKAVGLNPAGNEAMAIGPDGYANIEHYLNWLAEPHALTSTNIAVEVDLWAYTSGFTNAGPLYSVAEASNGVVTLTGHVARFTPAAGFVGLGSFQFVVVASDGSAYTNTVTVVVTPQPQPSYLTWRGDGVSNLWAADADTNWVDGTNRVAFSSGDTVTFDDTGSNSPAVRLTGNLIAGTVYVLAEQDYVFGGSGALAGATALFKTGTGKLTVLTTNSPGGGVVINEGIVQLGDGVSLNGSLAGNLTNNDRLVYANPGRLSSAASIAGSGALTKSGAGALTLSGTHSYTGPTTVNAGSLELSGALPPSDITNQSVLLLTPSSTQTYGNVIRGSGNVSVNASGVLILTGANQYTGNTTNTGGALILANPRAAGSGAVVYTGGYVVVANGVVVTNDFSMPSGATSDLSMMATNTGTAVWAGNVVNLSSGASWRPGSDGGTLVFTGTALQGSRNFIVPRGSVQFASNAVVSATGTATAFGRDGSANNRSANIYVKDNAAVTVGVCSLGGGKAGGSVTLTVQNNALLSFGANNLDLHNVARSTAVTTLRLNGGTTVAGGFAKTKTSYTNVINFNGGVLKAGANNAAFLPAFAAQTLNVQAGGAVIDDGGFAIAISAPLLHDVTLGATLDGGLTKLGGGTLTIGSATTFTGPAVVNAGTLTLSGAGAMAAASGFHVAAGATLGTGGMEVLGKQTLSGNGTITGDLGIDSGATLAPGSNGIGRLTFSASLTLADGSTNVFEISHAPLTNDLVTVQGTLTFGGLLVVANRGGSALAPGDSFQLFEAGGFSGAFAGLSLPALPAGCVWSTARLASEGRLLVVSTNAPVIGRIAADATGGLVFSGGGGTPRWDYRVLSTTNVQLPLAGWTRMATNQFDVVGGFNFTNAVVPGEGQRFYLLELEVP